MPPTEPADSTVIIALSERGPVKVDPKVWPLIVSTEHVNRHIKSVLHVRQHQDGRRIVYGSKQQDESVVRGGFLVDPGPDNCDDTVRAIRRVAGVIGNRVIGDECIGRLPPEELR